MEQDSPKSEDFLEVFILSANMPYVEKKPPLVEEEETHRWLPERRLLLGVLFRAVCDLETIGLYRRSAIRWFRDPNDYPTCVSFSYIVTQCDLSYSYTKYLMDLVNRADQYDKCVPKGKEGRKRVSDLAKIKGDFIGSQNQTIQRRRPVRCSGNGGIA